ncbi:MAG: phage head closure protein [Halocynthiibacter sp.]
MKTPRLIRKLGLEAAERVSDGAGGYSEVWTTKGTLWADIVAHSGQETAQASTTVSRLKLSIITRSALPDAPDRPRPDQRFRDGGRLYLIQSVAEYDSTGRYLKCSCVEEVLS